MDFFHMKFAYINGSTTAYDFTGSPEDPCLVFINSLGTDLRIWDDVIPNLNDRFYVVRYDKRGHGLSDVPSGPYTIDLFTADLVRLLDYLNVSKAVLVGMSVGGLIAMNTAVQYPQRVETLILCDTLAKFGTADYWTDRIEALQNGGMEPMTETILSRWFAPDFRDRRPVDYQGYANMLNRCPLDGYIATCAALADADIRNRIAEITVPTLVLCGSEDAATPPETVRQLAQAMPNAQFAVIKGAGHTPSVEQPEQFAETVIAFLKAHAT
jgi:3-oxoadipate enol-lactonase